ncbi:hypothetical protein PROFUN_13897 [Planoprotostelium fungivorum]|uniref:Uncharacterized protein n=1 Tax=Planoprotostelium fungivorum TaxID=1890364 RepID=A0A2P6N2A6_9EUKA|nr:hypothetical protein PROFUN_13897 [Planoprotostelium fungivorum]
MLTTLSERLQRDCMEDITKDLGIRRLCRGIQAARSTTEMEERLSLPVQVVRHYFVNKPHGMAERTWARNRVILVLGFAFMRRPGEGQQVCQKHVRFDQMGWMYIRLRRTKTLASGREIVIETTGSFFCPVAAVRGYLQRWPGEPEDPLFPALGRHISQIVKEARLAGIQGRFTGGAGEELRWDLLGRNNKGEPAVDLPVEPERSCDGTRPQIAQSRRGETIVPMAERGVHRRGKIIRAWFSYVPSRRFFTKAVDTPKNNETQIVGRM